MPIDAESGQSFLSVPGQYGSQIYGSRTLGPVKAPYGFRPIRIHVHRLRAITPTGSYGNRSPYPLALEFPGTGRTLAYAPIVPSAITHSTGVPSLYFTCEEIKSATARAKLMVLSSKLRGHRPADRRWSDEYQS